MAAHLQVHLRLVEATIEATKKGVVEIVTWIEEAICGNAVIRGAMVDQAVAGVMGTIGCQDRAAIKVVAVAIMAVIGKALVEVLVGVAVKVVDGAVRPDMAHLEEIRGVETMTMVTVAEV